VKIEDNSVSEYPNPDPIQEEFQSEEPGHDHDLEVVPKRVRRKPEVNEGGGDNPEQELWTKRRKLVPQIRLHESCRKVSPKICCVLCTHPTLFVVLHPY
jgi:hypothetical protein